MQTVREHIHGNAAFYGGEKGAYWARQDGKLTHRDILKRDVEYCLSLSRTPDDFRRRLMSLDYSYARDDTHREPSVMAPGWKRPVRLSSIGYSADVLNRQLEQNWEDVYFIHWRNANPIKKATPLLVIEREYRKAQHMDGIRLTFALFIELLSDRCNTILRANRAAKTAMDVFRDILENEKLERNDFAVF